MYAIKQQVTQTGNPILKYVMKILIPNQGTGKPDLLKLQSCATEPRAERSEQILSIEK